MPIKSAFQFPKPLPEKALSKATIATYKSKINAIAKEVLYKKETFVERELESGKKKKFKVLVPEPVDTVELLRDNPEPVIEFIKTQATNQIKRVFICAIFFILALNKDSPANKYYDYFQTIKTE
jgi:hypothetical protein